MILQINEKWKWAAKDKSGTLYLFTDKPFRGASAWDSLSGLRRNVDDLFSGILPDYEWQDSLHRIENGELIKHVELRVDDKVMVRNKPQGMWRKRYFSHFNGEAIYCFAGGMTSWNAGETFESWNEWRLPNKDEE